MPARAATLRLAAVPRIGMLADVAIIMLGAALVGASAQRSELDHFRDQIDAVDRELLNALERRVRLVVELWRLKKGRGLPRRDPGREDEIVSRLTLERGGVLDEEVLRDFLRVVLWVSHQEATQALGPDAKRQFPQRPE